MRRRLYQAVFIAIAILAIVLTGLGFLAPNQWMW